MELRCGIHVNLKWHKWQNTITLQCLKILKHSALTNKCIFWQHHKVTWFKWPGFDGVNPRNPQLYLGLIVFRSRSNCYPDVFQWVAVVGVTVAVVGARWKMCLIRPPPNCGPLEKKKTNQDMIRKLWETRETLENCESLDCLGMGPLRVNV